MIELKTTENNSSVNEFLYVIEELKTRLDCQKRIKMMSEVT
jgi:hypothetical protein